jgi:iron-sulfur cluster assembly accessory protein
MATISQTSHPSYQPDMSSITVTQAAKDHFIRTLMNASNKAQVPFTELFIKSSTQGCNGVAFQYEMKSLSADHGGMILNPQVDPQVDFVYRLHFDDEAASLLEGSTIDYVKDGINSRITYDIPKAQGSCGCGQSFNF